MQVPILTGFFGLNSEKIQNPPIRIREGFKKLQKMPAFCGSVGFKFDRN